ncbi:hypothetical protein F5Y17DRAFT_452874 [Xylariaceae sp. FL0594]|nr:hypothetical protein F5Y17DRAFT_452874 [Xylariaceae sp. FL0594]
MAELSLVNEPNAQSVDQRPYTLYEYLYPSWNLLSIRPAADVCQPYRVLQPDSPYLPPGQYLHPHNPGLVALDLDSWVPAWYSSRDVKLAPRAPALGREHPLVTSPHRVLVDEQRICFFKPFKHGQDFVRELSAFRTLHAASIRGDLSQETRICRLHGLVRDVETGLEPSPWPRIIGMLLTPFIETEHQGILGTLHCVAMGTRASVPLRHKWATQIENTVLELHRAGCVWGDAKPLNVMVQHPEGDAWLIDFGGGYTRGWVDSNCQNSVDGDLQGVKRIAQWLQTGALTGLHCLPVD